MAFNFNFFGTSEHRVFKYKPRYYDHEKEALRKKFGHVDNPKPEGENYTPGSYVKGSLRDGNYQRTKSANRAQQLIGVVGVILFFIVLMYITKFYNLLW